MSEQIQASRASAVFGWLKFLAVLVLAIVGLGVLGVLRAEQERDPVPTQKDLQAEHGLPVEVAAVRMGTVAHSVRLFGTVQGERQSEIVVPSPNLLERIHVEVGEQVREGQRLAAMRDVALSPLGFRLGPLRAQHEAAQADLARVENIHAQGGITDQKLEHAQAMARAAQSDYEAAIAAIHIASPIEGVVTRIDFRPGEMVPNDRPLMQVAAIDEVTVELMAESADVAHIREGHEATVTCAAVPGRTFFGQVTERSLGSYPVINQFRIRVALENADHALLPGYPVQVEIRVDSESEGPVVPRAAVVTHDDSPAVWVVADDGTSALRPVTLGVADDNDQAVAGDLAEGQRVVTLGQDRIEDEGARLIVVQD